MTGNHTTDTARARKAAESDFLWELGLRVPSSHQARNLRKILSLTVREEKLIKAVMRERHKDPQAPQDIRREIRGDGALKEEETMPETVWGDVRYKAIVARKTEDLWDKIFKDLGIKRSHELEEELKSKFPLPSSSDAESIIEIERQQLKESAFKYLRDVLAGDISSVEVKVFHPVPQIGRRPPADLGLMIHSYSSVFIFPTGHVFGRSDVPDPTREYKPAGILPGCFYRPSYYDYGLGLEGKKKVSAAWRHIVVNIDSKKNLRLAQKIAAAYERETKRRRKPAKAVVVKNY